VTDNQRRAITTLAFVTVPLWGIPYGTWTILRLMWRDLHDMIWSR
jgi:aromatic ring-opening dioxygenase catalytic subunit (LigB family)